MSATDRIIRQTHSILAERYSEAGSGEILDHLAWEVGGAASELVKPARWVREALVAAGVCANRSEAHARIARIVSEHVSSLDERISAEIREELGAGMAFRTVGDGTVESMDTRRRDAVARMERDMAELALPIHARLESCSLDELDQAATTMISLAMENGDPHVAEDVIVSLLIFSENWGDGRWWDGTMAEDPVIPPRMHGH